MNLDIQTRFQVKVLETMRASLGLSVSAVDPCESAWLFDQKYALKLAGKLFDPDGYGHWVPIYEDTHPSQVLMAAAQTGKTRYNLTVFVRSCFDQPNSMFGYYFPDFKTAGDFSAERFVPFMESNPTLAATVGAARESGKKGTDNIYRRQVAKSVIFFLSTKGGTSTESNPFAGVFFDEVRRMTSGDIERVEERTSAQKNPLNIKVSTAYLPEQDIHRYFLEGDQRWFHSECSCPDGVVLSKVFPECLLDLKGADAAQVKRAMVAFANARVPWQPDDEKAQWGEAVYVCPRCGDIIPNPRRGWWEADNPDAWVHSWQLPQLLSVFFPAARALHKYLRNTDVQELWNSMVGVPFLDPETIPVRDGHLMSCVDETLTWCALMTPRERKHYAINTAAGMDTMGGYNCIVIKRQAAGGKFETIHVEVLYGEDPWFQAAVLMQEYDVRIMVSDQEPHYNEAFRFAKMFKGRVWLANYGEIQGTKGKTDLVSWGDRRKPDPDQKGRETSWKFSVRINRTKGLQWSLGRWVNRQNVLPNPQKLIQRLPVKEDKGQRRVVLSPSLRQGTMALVPVCLDPYFRHQKSVAFLKEYGSDAAERTGDFKIVAEHIGGIDPHFAHAELYANVACARLSGNLLDAGED